jgi:predicted MFS family arabinose efflux permease
LLAIAMGGFTLANLLAAMTPGYFGLLAARLLLALSAASFMPAASGYAATLGGPERHGRALSMVTNGLTLAIIVGVPLGVLVGARFGWRATFLGVACLAALSLLGILARLPLQPPGATASLSERLALIKRRDIVAVLMTTVLTVAGTFTVYTYLGVFLAKVVSLGPGASVDAPEFRSSQCGRHPTRRQRGGSLGCAPNRDPFRWPCLARIPCPLTCRSARVGAGDAGPCCRPSWFGASPGGG